MLILGVTPQLSNLNAQALPVFKTSPHNVTAQLHYILPVSNVQKVLIRPEKPEVISSVTIR